MANLFNTAAQKVSDFANLDKVQALESKYGAGSTGLPSDARHMAAMNQLSNAIATPINKISEPLGTFVGDTGAFAAGLINEIPGVYRSIKGEAPIKDVWEDIAANWKGSFGTPNITTSEEIYKDVYGIPSIDPTGRNLFTQYGYEDDPYAGIEGQTAFLDPISAAKGLMAVGTKMIPKELLWLYKKESQINAGKKALKLFKKKKKTSTITGGDKKIITKKKKTFAPPGEKGGPGYTPPKKKYTPPSHQTGGSGGVHSGMKTTKTSAPQRNYSRHRAYGLKQGGIIDKPLMGRSRDI